MRKLARTTLTAALLIALAGAPGLAQATSYEDSLEDCGYPEIFDLMIMRTLSFASLVLGTALFIPIAPWAMVAASDDMGKVVDALVFTPARFTFSRPLGACGTNARRR